jgi:TRAP-type C4-dicarboxylate transport system permease large subunit
MFMGGLLPGLLLAAVYLGVHHYYVRHRWDITVTDTRYTFMEKLRITLEGASGAVHAHHHFGGNLRRGIHAHRVGRRRRFYTMVLGFLTKALTVRKFVENIRRTSVMSAAIAASLGCGYIFTYLMGPRAYRPP